MKFFERRKKAKEIERLLAQSEVPSFPQITIQMLQTLRNPESSSEDIAEALKWDPGLVVKMLGMVNSAAFGLSRPIESAAHAASFLGRSQVEQIVLAITVQTTLPGASRPGFEAARFWQAAAARAALGSALAARLDPARQGEAFTVGMLQDMAIPVLVHSRPDEYGPLLEAWHADPRTTLSEIEEEAFGWCHGDVGGHLGRHWKLPRGVVACIEGHHDPLSSHDQVPPPVRLVALLRETSLEYGVEVLVERAREDYGLDPDWTRETAARAEEEASELAKRLAA